MLWQHSLLFTFTYSSGFLPMSVFNLDPINLEQLVAFSYGPIPPKKPKLTTFPPNSSIRSFPSSSAFGVDTVKSPPFKALGNFPLPSSTSLGKHRTTMVDSGGPSPPSQCSADSHSDVILDAILSGHSICTLLTHVSVFKGKLHDKCPIALKVLKETKGNGEEFMNEVASISKTSHVNIVTLLGFCFEGSKRALVYEFMANGSLEKFIFENEADLVEGSLQLSSEILHRIVVGVVITTSASAPIVTKYLHRGCNTRIFHFDLKPHNILLDENFCPKISDFGLAKICPRNESVVSMLGARGTIGYIAPEVIYRNFGAVSHKSDVCSFGMMVLEMVGGRRNVNVNVDDTSEIYFPHWIYKRLELDEDLALRSIRNEGDKERIRYMAITSLWCIQTNPIERPMMSKVVEMLEGRVETLQVPPKPYLSSPSRSPCPSSCSTL
ncbi:hypothetical protein K1719_029778 [Acacia pycnantha]|nr:hypothetical protein K1719_029778 [Acacia pycnantha]